MSELKISILSVAEEKAYNDFLSHHEGALWYHSLKYRNFLNAILENSEDIYLAAFIGDKIVGILPAFLKRLKDGTSIINSLPFFGSHGGVLIASDIQHSHNVRTKLMDKLFEIAYQNKCLSLTIIDNPIASKEDTYEQYFQSSPSDIRTSQISDISIANIDNLEEELMDKFHYKTRNMVRKSLKSNFVITHDESEESFQNLHALHEQNMHKIGGQTKPFLIFKAIQDTFTACDDYRIYFAHKDGVVCAALLVFFYENYCEYFTPVVREEYRNQQPLSALIFQAMKDSVRRGIKYWNWGGTWLTQDGVYLFKKRWGAVDRKYSYYTKIFNKDLLHRTKEQILQEVPYYYCLNFKDLDGSR